MSNHSTRELNNYRLCRDLGSGSYGKVKLAMNTTFDAPVAMKIYNKQKVRKLGMQERVKREIKAMKKLQHPHIISLYQVIDTQTDIYLALELATGGSLFDRISLSGTVSLKNDFLINKIGSNSLLLVS